MVAGEGAADAAGVAEAAAAADVSAQERVRRRPLTLVLSALVVAVAALALARHSADNPKSSNAAFEQGQATCRRCRRARRRRPEPDGESHPVAHSDADTCVDTVCGAAVHRLGRAAGGELFPGHHPDHGGRRSELERTEFDIGDQDPASRAAAHQHSASAADHVPATDPDRQTASRAAHDEPSAVRPLHAHRRLRVEVTNDHP